MKPEHPSNPTQTTFWTTVPAIWHCVRSQIHHQATSHPTGLTVGQFHILRQIRNGSNSVSLLAESGRRSKPTISRMVDGLVNKGMILRIPDPDDRRKITLALSESGSALLKTISDGTHRWMSEKLEVLSVEELEAVEKGLNALHRAFLPENPVK